MKSVLIAVLLLAASPAFAADYTVTLSQDEAQTMLNALDVATKQGGLQEATKALPVAQKLIEAGRKAAEPKPEPTK